MGEAKMAEIQAQQKIILNAKNGINNYFPKLFSSFSSA